MERVQHLYDNGRDFSPALEKQKAEVNVEVASAGKRSWRTVTLSRSCNNQNGRVESYSHLLIFPTLWWYIRATTQNGEKYCQGGVEILHLRLDARIAVPTDDNLPLATCSTIRIARVREIRARWQWDSRQVRHLLSAWNNYRLNFQLVDTCTTRHETLRYFVSFRSDLKNGTQFSYTCGLGQINHLLLIRRKLNRLIDNNCTMF